MGTPSNAQTPPPTTADTRTFTTQGGTAQFSCSNNQITLNWATPNQGYWVDNGSSDSGQTIDLRFRSDTHESELQVSCSGNQVVASVQENSS